MSRPLPLRFFFALLWMIGATAIAAAEVDVDESVREVRAKEIVVIFGEREIGKKNAVNTLAGMTQQYPNVPETHWVYVRQELDFDALEVALTKHYASHFTSDELTHLAKFFGPLEMRSLVTAVRGLSQNPPPAEALPAELERLRQSFGPPMAKLSDLLNSALGRQLLSAQKSAEEIRRKEVIAALVAADARVRARR